MTRLILLASAFGLTLASTAGAMTAIPDIPSLWPAPGAFEKPAKPQSLVKRTSAKSEPAVLKPAAQ
ncbi:hypothetical protein [Roseovarius sp.]|uniref:hypothetical protein n=1 Tax=Roseovarius sp. TaxID=1486281 RepID=UPI0025FA948B|nr:hypothetical protein [Roseovarius sp.]